MRYLLSSCLAAGLAFETGAQAAETKTPTPAAKRPATETKAQKPADDDPPSLLLNLRGAQIEQVLNYLSDAAGFTIVLDGPVRGTIDVWNNQPVTKKEALEILDTALDKNGYACIQDGRTLMIMSKEKAFTRIELVETGLDPETIAKDSRIVTRIMPVAHINASQLIRELSPILPSLRTMVANEAGNAIIIKDTRANIRHLAEIVKALDTALASISSIKVIALKYADSKSTASLIKELFAPDTSSRGGTGGTGGGPGGFSGFTGRFGGAPGGGFGGPDGGGGFGGPGGGGPGGGGPSRFGSGGNSGGGGSSRGSAAAKVVAVADERSNSVVLTAPDDLMPTIEQLLESVDVIVDDGVELKVFHLKNADPVEMSELLASLFPDESKSNNNNNSNGRFGSFGGPGGGGPGGGPGGMFINTGGGGPGGGGGGGGSAASGKSERAMKQSRVVAVPDQRTASLVVTTSHSLMQQIEETIDRLDSDGSRKQKVYIYELANADPQLVQQILQELFQSQQNSRSSSRTTASNPLSQRATQSSQTSGGGNSSGTGGGLGSGLGGGAGATAGGGR